MLQLAKELFLTTTHGSKIQIIVMTKDDSKHKFAQIIQKYLEKLPLIILGTGATIPYGLPSMGDLSNRLKANISSTKKEWKQFVKDIDSGTDLESALQKNSLSNEITLKIIYETWEYINEKDLDFFSKLTQDSIVFPIKTLFTKLLQSHPKQIKVITTNYDRIAEYAADLSGSIINTGFTGRYFLNFNQNFQTFPTNQNCVEILKVHGSLDWFNKVDNTSFSVPLASNIPENTTPLIVTPGIVKYQQTHLEPYRTVINKADEAIMQASCYLCIGYGFNDEHIHPKLIQQLKQKNKPIVTVTKELSENGKKILLDNPLKSIAIEDGGVNKTKIHFFEDKKYKVEILDGNYWQLEHFIELWF